MPTAKALREALREVGIYNPHLLCRKGGGTVYVDYRPAQPGPAYHGAAWQIIAVRGPKTDPGAHWRDYGNKTFNVVCRAERDPQRVAALGWASEFLGLLDGGDGWVKDPFVAYQRPEVIESALASLAASNV